jgi:hypothetical protein
MDRTFLTCAISLQWRKALSFTTGAKKLNLAAQPSLTRQIKDLEEEIGVRLLDRTRRPVFARLHLVFTPCFQPD